MPIAPIEIDYEKYLPEIVGIPLKAVAEELLTGRVPFEKVDLIVRYLIRSGYRFSASELPGLKTMITSAYPESKLVKD